MILKEDLLELGILEDNEFLDKYYNLVVKNFSTKKEKGKTDRHHIIPKSYFKHNNLDVDNSVNNIINVYRSDHILLHYFLCLCSKDCYFKYANYQAFIRMTSRTDIPSDYIEFAKNLSEYQRIYEECNFLKSELYKGKPHPLSEEALKSKKEKIKQLRKEKSNKNKIWVNNGIEQKMIQKCDFENYQQLGYKCGRLQFLSKESIEKIKQNTKGKKAWNKGKICIVNLENGSKKYVDTEELSMYKSKGYIESKEVKKE